MSAALPPTHSSAPASTSAPWTGLGLLLVWLVGELCLMVGAGGMQGAAQLIYGPEWREALAPNAVIWLTVYAHVAVLPLRLLAGILTVIALSQATLADMGLSAHHLLKHILLGLVLAAPLALIVYAVQAGCEWLLTRIGADVVQDHAFSKLARDGMTPLRWTMLITAAVIVAPVWEEFLFRGLIQPWAVDRAEGPGVLLAVAACVAVLFRFERISNAWSMSEGKMFLELLPCIAVLLMVPVYQLLRLGFRSPVTSALFASAVLFGWFHANVWPSPVPLMVLALGLGWLRHHTGSLVAPITMHAAFNGIAVGMLVVELRNR